MKRFCWTKLAASMILTIALAGCASPNPTTLPTSAPTASVNSNTSASGRVTASAVVVPAQTSQLGFLLSAPVKEVDIKEGDNVKAGQTLVVLNTPELSLSVDAAQAALRSAQAKAIIRRYQKKTINADGSEVYLSGPPELRQIADVQVRQAQAALEIAQAILAQGTLVSPYKGTVVSLNIASGQFVQPGQVIAVIGGLDHLQIETTDLSERDIAKIQTGQTATVHIKALNQDFTGRVVAIAPMAIKHNADWVYKVTIEFDKPPQNLLWGMSANVEIQTGK